jgi:cytolysin (calcineurin-like family phosphatase)
MRKWGIVALAVMAVLGLTPAVAQLSNETTSAERAYEKCSTAMAERYATGIDAADLIAKAATEACRNEMSAVAQSMQRNGDSPALLIAAIEQINTDLARRLKLHILELRAKK